MERPLEGPRPEIYKNYPIKTAFELLAAWLGTTTEEVEQKFDIGTLINNLVSPGEPVSICIKGPYYDEEWGFATVCEVYDKRGWILGMKLIGYLYDKGEVRVANKPICV